MLIGIPVSKGESQVKLNNAYVAYVNKAGFEPILITPENNPAVLADVCNGLLLPGGIDIDPIYYGEDNDACLGSDVDKDHFERALFKAFVVRQKPVFGICRGFQLMAREAALMDTGNTEVSYMQDIGMHTQTSQSVPRASASHFIVANMHKLYNNEGPVLAKIAVNSMHHQGVIVRLAKNSLAAGLIEVLAFTKRGLSTKSGKDGFVVAEAADFYCFDGARVRGVQWHPEEMVDTALLRNFMLNLLNQLPVNNNVHAAAAK
jgi:putative glutamine amidotransferase